MDNERQVKVSEDEVISLDEIKKRVDHLFLSGQHKEGELKVFAARIKRELFAERIENLILKQAINDLQHIVDGMRFSQEDRSLKSQMCVCIENENSLYVQMYDKYISSKEGGGSGANHDSMIYFSNGMRLDSDVYVLSDDGLVVTCKKCGQSSDVSMFIDSEDCLHKSSCIWLIRTNKI